MKINPVIFILNTRLIPQTRDCFKSLPYPKLWISFYDESEVSEMFPELLTDAVIRGFSHISMVSDNFIVLNLAVKEIYDYCNNDPNGVYCSWSHTDLTKYTNIYKHKLTSQFPKSDMSLVDFYTVTEMLLMSEQGKNPQIWLNDFCFHTMSIPMWQKFPYLCYTSEYINGSRSGYYADYHLCYRLQAKGIPIRCLTNSRLYYSRTGKVSPEWTAWMWKQKKNPKSIYWEI